MDNRKNSTHEHSMSRNLPVFILPGRQSTNDEICAKTLSGVESSGLAAASVIVRVEENADLSEGQGIPLFEGFLDQRSSRHSYHRNTACDMRSLVFFLRTGIDEHDILVTLGANDVEFLGRDGFRLNDGRVGLDRKYGLRDLLLGTLATIHNSILSRTSPKSLP